MALIHSASLSPTKAEALAAWVPSQPWCTAEGEPALLGSFRFNDPAGDVGIETHLVAVGETVLHVPLTYRAEPLPDDAGLVTEMEHSVLGRRWVYDAVREPVYLMMAAAVAMTGQGEALGMLHKDGAWHIAPATARVFGGGGWSGERIPLDGFVANDPTADTVVANNGRFELTIHRSPKVGPCPPMGLAAACAAVPNPVVLAAVDEQS